MNRTLSLELPLLRHRVTELENLILATCNKDGDYIELWKEAVAIKEARELMQKELTMKKPTPGSYEAIAEGCKCPVLDNAHGFGYLGGVKDESGATVFVVNGDCPLHGTPAEALNTLEEAPGPCEGLVWGG